MPGQTLRVLVADDNPLNRRTLVRLLKDLGHTGVVVDDGQRALECLRQRSFDLLLLDDYMPGLDGVRTLAEIRRLEAGSGRHLPVIMCTGHDLPEDRQRYLGLGADGYLCKPPGLETLIAEIAAVLGLSRT